MKKAWLPVLLAAAMTTGLAQPAGTTHRLEATPATVAYGFYDAAAKPVLRIASGDIIDVDTLLTNTPRGLERAGVKPEDIQPSQLVDGKVGVHVKIPKSIFTNEK